MLKTVTFLTSGEASAFIDFSVGKEDDKVVGPKSRMGAHANRPTMEFQLNRCRSHWAVASNINPRTPISMIIAISSP